MWEAYELLWTEDIGKLFFGKMIATISPIPHIFAI